MRLKKIIGAAAVAAVTGALAVAGPASAAGLHCGTGTSGLKGTATCWGTASGWQVVAQCYDTREIRWPKQLDTKVSPRVTGGSSAETAACPAATTRIDVSVRPA